jgi:mRNA interferase MazF
MVIRQGDIYWVDLEEPRKHEPGYKRPHVVVQNNLFNESQIGTVVACTLTSNLNLAKVPGNVMLKKGEAGLSKDSVVNVAQMITLNKIDLVEKIGTLSRSRVSLILDGIKLVLEPLE